jgi:hypothetical protein
MRNYREAEMLVWAWCTSSSIASAAAKLQAPMDRVKRQADRLRRLGVGLKRLPRHTPRLAIFEFGAKCQN